jgi:transcriptional regulator
VSLYTPRHFAQEERSAIARLMHDYPFATLITPSTPQPLVSHVPLLFVADREPHGTLLGHVARANPHWQEMRDVESIAVFHGPHAYVSPSWYGDPKNAVPTWNYATVHAHGVIEIVDEPIESRRVLGALVTRFEGTRASPWSLAMPERQRDALVSAIVAFRMRIGSFEAKFKLSQNRPTADRFRVIDALRAEGYAEAVATADWMESYAKPDAGGER